MKSEIMKEEMKKLLFQSLPIDERVSLRDDGFKFKRPTRACCILAALYKKAASGDMSAIKEVLALIEDKDTADGSSEVTIIDDVQC